MNSEKLLSRQALNNGLVLEFWDLSRPLAGDRWQVVLEVRVPIPVTAGTLPPDLSPQLDQVIAALGQNLLFTKQEVRQFIPAGEVAGLLQQIEAQLLASLKAYLGHPDFAPRLIRKRLDEHRERQGRRQ
jgi:hypothetical protein